MKTEKSCNNCIYSISDWTNVCNSDHYCSNKQSEEYGYNAEYLNGCDEWKSIENLGNNDSICTKTGANDEDRTTGDTIYRQDAIDALTRKSTQLHGLHWGDYPEAPHIESGVLSSIEIIRELPSAQPERMRFVQQAVNTIMHTARSDSIKDKSFRNAARLIQNAIDGEPRDFEPIPDEPERKKGKWIEEEEDCIVWWRCSECNYPVSAHYNYCPRCGCRMKGESDE